MSGRAAPAAGGARLGNTGNSFSAEFDHQSGRERRMRLQGKVRKHARRDLVEHRKWVKDFVNDLWSEDVRMVPRDDKYLACGMRSRGDSGRVQIRAKGDDGRAGFGNLQACGSVWGCPVCAAKIMRRRSRELGQVLAWARSEGHTIAMVTLTVRHQRGDRLSDVWDAVGDAWHAVTRGSKWASEKPEKYQERLEKWEAARELAIEGRGRYPRGGRENRPPVRRVGDQERFGVMGWARAAEVTFGANGWHVHVHAVVVLRNDQLGAEGQYNGQSAALQLGRRMYERWNASLPENHRGIEGSGGLDVQISAAAEKRLAEYLAKDGLDDDDVAHIKASNAKGANSVAMEATHGGAKQGKKGGRTPFQILDGLDYDVQTKHAADQDLAAWLEWLDASEGRRQITWSQGLRELAGLAEEAAADEEIANEDEGGDVVLTLPRETWKAVRDERWVLLDVYEIEGMAGLTGYLDRLGLDYGYPATERMTEWAEDDGSLAFDW